ncbi:MAG: hypothetical protein V1846_03155 [Candidatus Komeilibacteria bacterium]
MGAAFGAQPVDQLVCEETEAAIAITDSVATAFNLVEETEKTDILLVYFEKCYQQEVRAVAERFPQRVTAVVYIATADNEVEVVPFLHQLITNKMKEV